MAMEPAFVAEMKAALEKEQTLLESELGAISHADTGDHAPGDRAANFPNYGDDKLGDNTNSPNEIAAYEEAISTTTTLQARLVEVKAALERIEAGTYGTDISSGEAIGEDRLRANPAAAINITS